MLTLIIHACIFTTTETHNAEHKLEGKRMNLKIDRTNIIFGEKSKTEALKKAVISEFFEEYREEIENVFESTLVFSESHKVYKFKLYKNGFYHYAIVEGCDSYFRVFVGNKV